VTSFIRFFVERDLIINLVSFLLLAGGIYAASSMQREAFPPVNFDLITITASYSGASPEEVEQLLVTPIEQEIKSLDGIEKISSTSFPGSMEISVEVDPHFKERSRLVTEIQQAIDRADLPDDLRDSPFVLEIKSEQVPVLAVAIYGDLPDVELKRIGDLIEDDILDIEGVAKVIIQGDRREEIRVTLKPDELKQHRISAGEVISLLRKWNVNAPGGAISTKGNQKIVRIIGEFKDAEDTGSLVLRANERGQGIRLDSIATIEESLELPWRYVDASGKSAINMIILKKKDADIIDLVDRVRLYLKTIPDHYGQGLQVRTYHDFSTITRLRLGVLTSNGSIGLVLVLMILLVFLRPSVAITTSWGIPIIFFSGLLVLYFSGITLNLLVMLAFIIALGLMVDDAIIVGENATYHMERGLSPKESAVLGTVELLGPVTTTVLTTIVAFLPLMFMYGIIGKFVWVIPVVVVLLLSFSLLEAFFILPAHIKSVANPHKRLKKRVYIHFLEKLYGRVLRAAIRFRYITVALTILSLVGAVGVAREMDFQLFPSGAEDQFYLRVTAPTGTTLEEMREILLNIDQAVRERIDPNILETTVSIAGQYQTDAGDPLKQLGDRFGQVRVIFTPFTKRTVSAYTVMEKLKKEIPPLFPDVTIAFTMMKPGPPVGRALQAEISGKDETAVVESARRLIDFLKGTEGVHSIESGLEKGDPEIHVHLDRQLAAFAGVDLATAATHIKAAFDGTRATTLRRGKKEIDVTVRYPEKARSNIRTLKELLIPNQSGGLIPLGKIATFSEHQGIANIRHKDGRRIMLVTAEVDNRHITSQKINRIVEENKPVWLGKYLDRVKVHLGGEKEKTDESVRGLLISFVFALIGIFVILAAQFNNMRYPLVVMLPIPFGIVGIVGGFYLHAEPLSFMALMGFVGLTGVVVNGAIVLVVFLQRSIQAGVGWRKALIQSGRRRVRPVLLTAMTTVVGLLPTAYGWGGYDPFVAPMALALSWGLMFSTLVTLLFLPASIAVGMDLATLFHRKPGKSVP